MEDADQPNTLSELLRCIKWSEAAYCRHSAIAERYERQGNAAMLWYRMQAQADRFHPDPVKSPGVDDLEAICQAEFGSGLTAENLCQIRGRLAITLTPVEANSMTIQEAVNRLLADRLKGIERNVFVELDCAAWRLTIASQSWPLTEGLIKEFLAMLISRDRSGRITPKSDNVHNWKNAVDMLRRKIGKKNLRKVISFESGGFRVAKTVHLTGRSQYGLRRTSESNHPQKVGE